MGSEQSIIKEKEDNNDKENKKDIFNILNVYPDIPDYRDYQYNLSEYEKEIKIKKELDLRNIYDNCKLFNISNNGCTTSACISTVIYNELRKKGEDLFVPSISFIFYNSLLIEYNTKNFDKKFVKNSIRNSLKSLNRYGICSEEILPSNLDCIPYSECYDYGKYFNFKYSRLSNDLENIKKILNNNKCIICNLTLYTSFLKDKMKNEGILDYPDEYDSILGMISCILVGYTENKMTLKFFLGDKWGDKGYFYIDYKYLKNLCNDFWILEVFIDKKKNMV